MYKLITVPSGQIYDQNDIEVLTAMHDAKFVRYSDEPFTLKSGIESHVYVFGREDLTDNPGLEITIGDKMCQILKQAEVPEGKQICLIGIPTAGTSFAQAAAMTSVFYGDFINGLHICHRIMKEKPKDHGAHKGWINGKPNPDHDYWLVDNVATNGASKPEAQAKLVADGYPGAEHTGVFIWIDRQQGATEFLKQSGYRRVVVAYNLLDLAFVYGELGLWPKDTVK